VKPRQTPDNWNLFEVFSLSFAFGLYNVVSSIVLFVLVREGKFHDAFNLPLLNDNEIRGMIYLQVIFFSQLYFYFFFLSNLKF
jgi:hypothetical protein